MMKLTKVKWIAAAMVAGMLTLSTTSCKNDDPSLQEMQEEIWLKANDVTAAGLYGRVKTATTTNYNDTKWENNTIIEGEIRNLSIIEYDNKGYQTKFTYKYNISLPNGTTKTLTNLEITSISRDTKQRETESIMINYNYNDEGNVTTGDYSKYVTIYDDKEKTAAVIITRSSDGVNFTDSSKTIYKQNKYGRIDFNNYEDYYTKAGFTDAPHSTYVTEYDNQGNPTLIYQKFTYPDSPPSISGYSKTAYTYY